MNKRPGIDKQKFNDWLEAVVKPEVLDQRFRDVSYKLAVEAEEAGDRAFEIESRFGIGNRPYTWS